MPSDLPSDELQPFNPSKPNPAAEVGSASSETMSNSSNAEQSGLEQSSSEPFQLEPSGFETLQSEQSEPDVLEPVVQGLAQEQVRLKAAVQALKANLGDLEAKRDRLQTEIAESQDYLAKFVQDTLGDLERRKHKLHLSIEQLERRQERIREEMRSTFAGSSQEVAIRVQSFKDYLVGSLEDLVAAAQKLEIGRPEPEIVPSAPMGSDRPLAIATAPEVLEDPQFSEPLYERQTEKIKRVIALFRNEPDYYGPTWKLRRTFESIHTERVNDWFFTQGGRGSIRSLGSRLQNILVASAVISILYNLYGDKLRPLVLANSPERLGEWRRGLQDCLGLRRDDFGADRGVTLFEAPEPLISRADRLQKDQKMPLIIIDETEESVNLALLQFPLWLAFAGDPQKQVVQQAYFY
ncbi:DUF3086 domain-containing protein [Alkalinema pantanalense CENA528]|uniref:DUF3086 domain-containing protein n=1 Tax=Alkalinema pantanalense TaxID=1620705 RepID=UPI003D6DB262